ncbi:MAG TPA: hypothetical protein VF492_04740, partial [Verrucomicrobiae bacterium]
MANVDGHCVRIELLAYTGQAENPQIISIVFRRRFQAITTVKIHKRFGGIPAEPLVVESALELLVGFHALRRRGLCGGGAAEDQVAAAGVANVFQFVMRILACAHR